MRYGKLIAGSVLVLLLAVGVGWFMAYRWVKTNFGHAAVASTAKESAPSSNNKEAASTQTAPLPFVIKGAVMAQAFHNGQLPAPLPQPQGTPEQAAAELAKRVV